MSRILVNYRPCSCLILLLWMLLLNFEMLDAQTTGGPDDYGYTWRSSDDVNGPQFQWQDLKSISGSTNCALTDEICTNAIMITGGFNFYGINYSSIYIGDNGWMNFIKKQASPYHPFIYSGSEPNCLIAPFGEDLNCGKGKVYYYNDNIKKRFVVQYDSVPRFLNSGYHSFQVILDKQDSTIVLQYKNSDNWHYTDGNTGYPVTGIENPTGTTGINLNNAILKNNLAIKFYRPAPYIHFNPSLVSFKDTWVGNSDSTEITLLNSGKKKLLITSISLKSGSPFSLHGLPVGFPAQPLVIDEVNSGAMQKFFVSFTPTDQYTANDTLIILSNSADKNRVLKIPITATSVKSILSVLTPSVDFGNVQIEYRSSKDMDLILKNNGSAGLVVKSGTRLQDNSLFKIVRLPSALPFTIAAGMQDTISIRFAPTSTGIKHDTLNLFTNSTNLPVTRIPLTGAGVASQIAFTPSSVSFDSTVQGVTATKNLRISNPGTYSLTVNSISLLQNESFSLSGVPTSFTIAPGAYRDITVTFIPVRTGMITDSIRIRSNLPNDYFVAVGGTGILPILSTLPDMLDFGQVLLGSTKSDSILVKNTGNGTLLISAITLTALNSFSLTTTFAYPLKIYAGGQKKVKVNYAPQVLGYVYNNLKIVSNAGTVSAQLIGKGVFPAIEVSNVSLNYGSVQVGLRKTDSLYIKNNGSADLIVSGLAFESSTNFNFTSTPVLPLTIAPGANYKLKIDCAPQVAASLQDKLTITHNSGVAQYVTLSGNGSLPGLQYSQTSVTMDSTLENQTSSKYLWLKNNGNQQLNILSLKTKTDRFEVFVVTKNLREQLLRGDHNLNFVINAGDSLRLRVEFRPNENILFMDSIITNAAVIGRSSLPLIGQGTRASYSLSSVQLNFADQTINSSKVLNLLLTGSGNGKLFLQSLSNLNSAFKIKNMPSLPLLLNFGESYNLQIEFKPLDFGNYSDTLLLVTNSNQGIARIPLQGFGRGGGLQLSRTLLNYGSVAVGDSGRDSLYIYNYGNAPLVVSDLTINGDAGIMNVESPAVLPVSIAGKDSVMVAVSFHPMAVMNYKKYLTVNSNSVFADPNQVELNGSGISATIYLNPNHLDFGAVHLDSLKYDSLTIYNNGTANLLITELTLTGSSAFGLVNAPHLPLTIYPGQNRKLKLQFTALSSGELSAVLNIGNNAANNVQVNLNGIGALGNLVSSTAVLDFMSINAGSQLIKTLHLKNTGNYPLQLKAVSVTSAAFSIEDNMSGRWLLPGDSLPVAVTFMPLSYQNCFDFLVVESDVGDLNIQLQGIGLQSDLMPDQSQLSFAPTAIGKELILPLKMYNRGNKALKITALNFESRSAFESRGIVLPATINPKDSLSMQVVFLPLQPTEYSDSLIVENDSPNRVAVAVNGTGNGSNLVLSQTLINFNEVVLGSSSSAAISIRNSGNSVLTIDSLYSTLPMEFILNDGINLNLPITISAGSILQIPLKFQPQKVGSYQGQIRFVSNSYDVQSDYIIVNGYGVSPNIAVSPVKLDYGIVKIGTNGIKYFKIINTGNSNLRVDSLSFRHRSNFTLADLPAYPLMIAAGTSINIGVKFQASALAASTDTLDVYNDSNNGIYVALQGEGGSAKFQISSYDLAFGNVEVLDTKNQRLVLTNRGNYSGSLISYHNQQAVYLSEIVNAQKNVKVSSESAKQKSASSIMNVQPGDSVVFDIRFKPLLMQSYLDTLNIQAENFSSKTLLSGKGIKALALIEPSAINFGETIINGQKSDTLTISNSGNSDLIINQLELVNKKGFTIRNHNEFLFPLKIIPGQKIALYLDFQPTELITYTEKIRITGNNWQQANTYIYLTGSGKSSSLAVTPTLIEYGAVELGNVVNRSVSLKNMGNIPLSITSITKKLSVYKLLNLPSIPFNLAPGQQINFNVQFLPNQSQIFNDTIKINTSAIKAEIVLNGSGSHPQFNLSANSLNFDSVYVNSSSYQNLKIKNPGTSPLLINSISHKLPVFAFVSGSRLDKMVIQKAVYTVLPGDSLNLLVTFVPKQTAVYQDTLVFNSNSGIKKVALYGKGAKAALTVNKKVMQFKPTKIGDVNYDSLMIYNGSSLPVQISNLQISSLPVFKVNNVTLPLTIAAGDSVKLVLSFQPLQLVNYTASLQIINNSGYNPQVGLQGSVLCGDLYLSALEKDFGAISVGDLSIDSVKIVNRGTASLSINDLQIGSGRHFQLFESHKLPLQLNPGDSTYVAYQFKPLFYSANQLLDTLSINTSEQQADFILRGRAVNVLLTFDPSELNFGELSFPYADTLAVKAKNVGEGRILVKHIQLQHPAPFALSFTPQNSLNSGAEVLINIVYRPQHQGDFTDSLKIESNGPIRYLKLTASCHDSVSISQPAVPWQNEVFCNYPNPFNSNTILPYSVQSASEVALAVYNVKGQLVKSLRSNHQKAGCFNFNISMNSLSGGVYYYRLTINDDYSKMGKLVLCK